MNFSVTDDEMDDIQQGKFQNWGPWAQYMHGRETSQSLATQGGQGNLHSGFCGLPKHSLSPRMLDTEIGAEEGQYWVHFLLLKFKYHFR